MKKYPKNFFGAVAVMVGFVIGVGMFGVPYLTTRAGIISFFILFIILSLVQYLVHMLFANLVIISKKYRRLPGFAEVYLGKKWKKAVLVAKLVGNYGALLAYIIITGIFLSQLFSPVFAGSEFFFASLLFAFGALILYFGIHVLARAELIMTLLLLLIIIIISWKSLGAVKIANYPVLDWKLFLLPYGAMLFALDGNGAIPLVVKLLKKNKEAVKKAITIGTFLPAIAILLFTLSVVGVSGQNTTQDALTGLQNMLGSGVLTLALLFGVLTMATSFLGVGQEVIDILNWDFKVNRKLAWALSVFVPYLLYLAGLKNLIGIISFAGAIAGGLCAITLLTIYKKVKNKDIVLIKYRPGPVVMFLLFTLFISGLLYEIYYYFIK